MAAVCMALPTRAPTAITDIFPPWHLSTTNHSSVARHGSVTDAILGALTLPDIGQFFPDTDPRWKGADSEVFLEEARKKMDERGYKLSNLDVTLILQACGAGGMNLCALMLVILCAREQGRGAVCVWS